MHHAKIIKHLQHYDIAAKIKLVKYKLVSHSKREFILLQEIFYLKSKVILSSNI